MVETIVLPAALVLNGLGLLWAVAKWLGSRGVAKVDETLAKLEAIEKQVDQLVHVIKTIERMDAKMEAFSTRMTEHDRKLVEQDIRIRTVEAQNQRLLQHVEDLSGYLSREGREFRKRSES